jgi:hypothetical protein
VKEDDPLAFDVLVDDQPLMYLRAFSNRFARTEHVSVLQRSFYSFSFSERQQWLSAIKTAKENQAKSQSSTSQTSSAIVRAGAPDTLPAASVHSESEMATVSKLAKNLKKHRDDLVQQVSEV